MKTLKYFESSPSPYIIIRISPCQCRYVSIPPLTNISTTWLPKSASRWKKEMWKYYFLISSCFLEISHNSSVGKINIIGSSSSIFQFEGRVWFEEPEIIAGKGKAKVGGAVVESIAGHLGLFRSCPSRWIPQETCLCQIQSGLRDQDCSGSSSAWCRAKGKVTSGIRFWNQTQTLSRKINGKNQLNQIKNWS